MKPKTAGRMSGKKKILLILCAFLVIAASAGAYVWINPQILVTERTVRLAGEQMGFNMEDAEIFSEQLRAEIENINLQSLGSDEKKKYFKEFMDPGHIRMAVPVITKLPEDFRGEAVDQAAALIRGYRHSLTPGDKSELQRYLGTPAGKNNLKKARRYITAGISHYEKEAIAPLIEEFERLIIEIHEAEF